MSRRESATDPAGWTSRQPAMFQLALGWARWMPRGKGWFPRQVGRSFLEQMQLLVETEHGGTMAVWPRDLDYYTRMLSGQDVGGLVRDACLLGLPAGGVLWDVGAHAGYVAVEVAAQRKGDVTIVAIEPQAELAKCCRIGIAASGAKHWHVLQMMLSDASGEGDLFVPTSGYHASIKPREAGAQAVRVPMSTVDELVASGTVPRPHVLKVDVEGAERAVFQGARRTIAEHRPWVIFECDSNAARFGYGRADLLADLREIAPYRFFKLADGKLAPLEEDDAVNDVVAVAES